MNYTNFKGRARRSEYWNFVFFVSTVLFVLDLPFGPFSVGESDANGNAFLIMLSILSIAFYLVSILPLLAVSVRRLHDRGRSGCFLLTAIIPILNLWLLFEFCRDSEPFANKYGENPKEQEKEIED